MSLVIYIGIFLKVNMNQNCFKVRLKREGWNLVNPQLLRDVFDFDAMLITVNLIFTFNI